MKKLFILPLIALMFASCDDFLSTLPDNRAEMDNEEAIRMLLVSAYPGYGYELFTEMRSDNAYDKGTKAVALSQYLSSYMVTAMKQSYMWETVTDEEQDTPTSYWSGCYEAIAAANHAIEALDLLIEEGANEKYFDYLYGEAYVCRAYAHFMLLNIFAPPYDPATADTDLGIPYVTEPEKVVIGNYERNTVQECYDMIVADLEAGFPLIDDSSYSVPKYHFTTTAAAAFASRLYLFLGDYDKVLEYAAYALGTDVTAKLRNWNGEMAGMDNDVAGVTYSNSSTSANLLLTSNVSTWGRHYYGRYGLPRTNIDPQATLSDPTQQYYAADYNVTGQQLAYEIWGISDYNTFFINGKWYEYFKLESINANYGLPYVMDPVLTSNEVLLNRIEAKIMNGDYDGAIDDISSYYSKVVKIDKLSNVNITNESILAFAESLTDAPISPMVTLDDKKEAYLKLVLNMRRTEFLHDGMRWFDIRRYFLSIKHQYQDDYGNLVTIKLDANDSRKVLEIPTSAIEFGLVANFPSAGAADLVKPVDDSIYDFVGDNSLTTDK